MAMTIQGIMVHLCANMGEAYRMGAATPSS